MTARPAPPLPSSLARSRGLIQAGLQDAVGRLAPSLQRVAAYHLGWRDQDGHEVEQPGGKAVRPTLTLLAAEAVGAPPASAVPGAVALELVHNFSLIHDDLMDGDRERRHRPTVWALFGAGEAIIAGDALAALAYAVLLEVEGETGQRAGRELTRATLEMIRGQSEDLTFESRLDVTEEEVVEMSAHKTGALMSCACALGAVLGGGTEQQVDALRTYGRHVGIAFQAVDDVLGIWGRPDVTGKPAAGDLRQHKKTLPVVHALAAPESGGTELAALLSDGEVVSEAGIDRALEILDASGGRAWSLGVAEEHLALALAALDGGGLVADPMAELRDMALFVVGRDF
jgi:geranylgeranyl diphosphate synthase, type I